MPVEKRQQLKAWRDNLSLHFAPTMNCRDLIDRYVHLANGEFTEVRVIVAGRVVAYRNSGMFLDYETVRERSKFCAMTISLVRRPRTSETRRCWRFAWR